MKGSCFRSTMILLVPIAALLLMAVPGRSQKSENINAPVNAGIPARGAEIDSEGFTYSRAIIGKKPGLSILPLDAAVLAHSRLFDIRIAGNDRRQIPYLMEEVKKPLSLNLPPLEKATPEESQALAKYHGAGAISLYQLHLPYSNLPSPRLVFTTSAKVFDRKISIFIEHEDHQTYSAAETYWIHSDTEEEAPPLTVQLLFSLQTAEALVMVEEGDNSPLPITSVKLLLPSYELRFFRGDETDLKLYYGRNDIEGPRYDIEMLANRLHGAEAEKVTMGPEKTKTPPETQHMSQELFWGILIFAVLALLILIARLIRKV
jgi:hypothetical protein